MNKLTWVILLLGVALGAGVFVWVGAGRALHAVLSIGALGYGEIVLVQLVVFVVLGLAWSLVCPGVKPWVTVWGRLVREGGETCLPFSEVGGLVFGGRAIMLFGADWTLATASSLIDIAAEGTGEAPFVLFGLLMLLIRKPGSSLILPVSLGVCIAILGGVTAFLLRHRIASLVKRGMNKLARKWAQGWAQDGEQELEKTMTSLAARRGHFAGGCLLHLLAWFGGGVNIWITYHLLGARIGILQAIAIESMLSAVLSVGFLIPGGIGVQEAAYVALGSLFGMPTHLSLALSLLRRARDVGIGVPSLLSWQALEARRLRTQGST